MTRAAQLPHQKVESLARLSQAVRANIDALERGEDAAKARLVALEAFEAYVRDELYPYLITLAAAVPFSPPPAPPP
jgi:hypothetical protein